MHTFLSISTVCNTPMKPVNGDVYSDGLTAIYSCRTGFTMKGVEKRYCGTDGSGWNETEPTCSKYSSTRICWQGLSSTNKSKADTHKFIFITISFGKDS